MSKARNFYILIAIAMFVAVPTVALAWVEDRLDLAISLGALALSWCVMVFTIARKVARHREINSRSHLTKTTRNRRRIMVLERTLSLLVFAGSAASLTKALVSDLPLYFVLGMVWFIIFSGGHFLFLLVTRFTTDK